MSVYRVYAEKKPGFDAAAQGVLSDLKTALHIDALKGVRLLNRYDVEGISREVFERALNIVFSEPQADTVTFTLDAGEDRVFAVEYLPGQFDQRADSCEQCIQLMAGGERPRVRTARCYLLQGKLTDEEFAKIKAYLINPVEAREAALAECDTLASVYEIPGETAVLTGFCKLSEEELAKMVAEYGLAMDRDDLAFLQAYFRDTEKRDPFITELRIIDTYWSDHCRHTTFGTHITSVELPEGDSPLKKGYEEYLAIRKELYGENTTRPITLMDAATIGAKYQKRKGILKNLDESEEINACSVKVQVKDEEGGSTDALLMFKNETHNHPTEIEPFGGAATCLGGAIRDPLSGRSYVYQAMRITGAADPTVPVSQTMAGKLPQRKLCVTAANGYSSYGNQIGLATGYVKEIYHPGYAAKRMEIGAVLGAAYAENVKRIRPEAGDIVILLGGRTGRDGCGGATGSSKSHTLESIDTCGAEVQKGNPPEERKLQRLFRNPAAARLIKRCNDFGAGGVSVAIGELAEGLDINLDAVPKKYDGLDATELAISESQERMAVVVAAEDVDTFRAIADTENLEATVVAKVTDTGRLRMFRNDKTVVDIARSFLDTNGTVKKTTVSLKAAPFTFKAPCAAESKDAVLSLMQDLNVCSQRGLVERFDATIGSGSVLMPYGGARQLTETQAMAAKIPLEGKRTTTASLMAYGFRPEVSEKSPYHGALCAVVDSAAKVIAAGGTLEGMYLTFQEYFERTKTDPTRWGKPFSALLGALKAQNELGIAAIGGKDSMSGTFEDLDVPPTLVSFAVSTCETSAVLSPEFKAAGDRVVLIAPQYTAENLPDFDSLRAVFAQVQGLIAAGKVRAAWVPVYGGITEGLCKMTMGNHIGFAAAENADLSLSLPGSFILELAPEAEDAGILLGHTTEAATFVKGAVSLTIDELTAAYASTLEPIFPVHAVESEVKELTFPKKSPILTSASIKAARPKVVIPVFPGTNCEDDTRRAFEAAGADAEVIVIRNLTSAAIGESVEALAKALSQANILMIPGGFSGGDEPEGSGKFINAFLRNPRLTDAVHELLFQRDGLALGICNGFQALIKLGLVPFGKITEPAADAPTLTFNSIGRHQSRLVSTKVVSRISPWLRLCDDDSIYSVPISHGEGRFIAPADVMEQLIANGQVATVYADAAGLPTSDIDFNPNNSLCAVEGITSADGRVLGKMAHCERAGLDLYKNVPGNHTMRLFESGVSYFK